MSFFSIPVFHCKNVILFNAVKHIFRTFIGVLSDNFVLNSHQINYLKAREKQFCTKRGAPKQFF
jgi:hypothetical protein